MDIISHFNLPKYVKGKSFAEASALIAKKFEGRTSPEDIATLNELQGRLREAQEFVKFEKEKRSKPKQAAQTLSSPGGNGGAESLDSELALRKGGSLEKSSSYKKGGYLEKSSSYEEGGFLSKLFNDNESDFDLGNVAKTATGALSLAKMISGKNNIDTSGAKPAPDVPSKGAVALNNAAKGAMAGKQFGPWGAAIGGVVSGVTGLISGGKAEKDAEEAAANYDMAEHYRKTNMYDDGGDLDTDPYNTDPAITEGEQTLKEMKHFLKTGRLLEKPLDPLMSREILTLPGFDKPRMSRKQFNEISGNSEDRGIDNVISSGLKEMPNQPIASMPEDMIEVIPDYDAVSNDERNDFNIAELLRYSPAIMNASQLSSLEPSESIGLDRLNNKYRKQLVDERGVQNTVQDSVNNMRNAILSSSGGSGSAARANLLASQLQGSRALSQAYQQAGAENRQERRREQEFDANIDRTNLSQSNQEKNLNLEQKAAYQTNRSKLLAQLGQDLGGIGREELFKRYPELMGLSYDWKGKHKSTKKK